MRSNAGHLDRMDTRKWARKVVEWTPRDGKKKKTKKNKQTNKGETKAAVERRY